MKFVIFCVIGALLIVSVGCYSPPVGPAGEPQLAVEEEMEVETEDELVLTEWELPPPGGNLPVSSFGEIWTYLVSGRENALNPRLPISDLVYFGSDVNSYGELVDVPDFRNIAAFKGRKHLVIKCDSRSLTYFVLKEGSPERAAFIKSLLDAARPYDGFQVDLELVPARSANAFLSFLRELRLGLGNKVLSIALPARTRTLENDVYDYAKIAPIVDRILVMAYDEHWSTSAPGPIASMGWCQRVARYSLETIGKEKLIMGLPFYGRSWGSENLNVAYVHSTVERVKNEQNIKEIQRDNSIPNFKYETTLSVTVFYEDEYSLATRMDMYKKMGVNSVGFWRLGQETQAFWPHIKLQI